MKRTSLTLFLVVMVGVICAGQSSYPTRDSTHIFWQPNLKITPNDYKGQPTKEVKEFMEKYDCPAIACVGIWSILDIPKKKKERYTKFEKVYFAPAFDRAQSYTETGDTVQINMQNLYFDMCEIWARWARQELIRVLDLTKATGTLTIMYMTVRGDMEKNKKEMYRSYFKDVFIDKREGAFAEWQGLINQLLDSTKEFATTPEECYRLMTKKPIEEEYIEAPTVFGSLHED